MGTHPIFESDFDCLTETVQNRHGRHQGYWSTILQHHLQEGRYRHLQAGQLDDEEIKRMETIMLSLRQYKVPDYFLNRQKDAKDGTFTQVISNGLETKLREDLERMKKIRCHRGLRHYWMLRVRGQHTKTTGRRGRTVGVSKKK